MFFPSVFLFAGNKRFLIRVLQMYYFLRTHIGVNSAEHIFISYVFTESRHCHRHRHVKLTRQYTLLNHLK